MFHFIFNASKYSLQEVYVEIQQNSNTLFGKLLNNYTKSQLSGIYLAV